MLKRTVFLVVLIFTSVESHATPNHDWAHPEYALDFYRFNASVKDMERDITANPKSIGGYIRLAAFYYRNEIWGKTVEVLKEAIKHRKEGFEIDLYGWMADALLNQNKPEEGKQALDIAIKEFPDRDGNYYNLGIYYALKKDYVSAGQAMKTIAAKDKKNEDPYYDFYVHLLEQKQADHNGLIQMAKAALEAEPENYKTHRIYAIALRNAHPSNYEKDFPEILAHLQKAFALNPKYILTPITLANTYLIRGLYQRDPANFTIVLEWLDKAKAIDPKYANLDYVYGNAYLLMQDYPKAVKYLEKYNQKNPDDSKGVKILATAYNGFAYDRYKKGEHLHEALKMVGKSLKMYPEDGLYLSTKAEVLYKLGRYPEAYELIKQARIKLPNQKEINRDVAMIEAALGISK